jgi:hypothetical protein
MNEHFPHILINAEYGARIIRDGLKICFYMRRPERQVVQAVAASLDTYLRAVGPGALAWYNDHQGDWGELDASTWDLVRRDLLEPRWLHHKWIDDPSRVPDFCFEYYGKALDDPRGLITPGMVSSVGFWLPTEFLAAHGPARVRELALELAAPLPFNSGHAGLCFNAMWGYRETEEALSRLCLRYPGLDMVDVESLANHLGTRIKAPAWMTFLGQPILGELGGADGLRARLTSPGTTVQQLEGERAVITLGPWPEAGDMQEGRTLPEYRELARLLEPWLYHSRGPWPYFPEDIRQRWERRFLD